MTPLFRIVQDSKTAIPVLATEADGTPRVADGILFFDLASAAELSGRPADELALLWRETINDLAGETEGELLIDAATGEAKSLTISDLTDAEILDRALRRQRGDFSLDEWAEFTVMARAMGYSIEKRECYPKRTINPETGKKAIVLVATIGALEARVMSSGTFNGIEGPLYSADGEKWVEAWPGTVPPAFCKVVYYRKGTERGVPIIATWDEFVRFENESGDVAELDRFLRIKFLVMLSKWTRAKGMREVWRDIVGNVYDPSEIPSSRPPVRDGPKPVAYSDDAPMPGVTPGRADGGEDESIHTESACRRALTGMGLIHQQEQDRLINDARRAFSDMEDFNPGQFWGGVVAKGREVARARRRVR
jgi:hypothetical protein